jgi:glutaredoxin
MKRSMIFLVSMVLAGQALAVEMYRWVDEKGRVQYSDQRPPSNARNVQIIGKSGARTDLVAPEADKNAKPPVTLYSSGCGAPCDQAKALLDQRAIPYTIKDATDPAVASEVKKLTGAQEVPVLTIGSNVHKGFERTLWNSVLDAAGHRPPPKEPAAKP